MKNENTKNEFKKIANYASIPEAEMAANILKKSGINVLIQGEETGAMGFTGGIIMPSPAGISLFVSKNDFEKAKSILLYRE